MIQSLERSRGGLVYKLISLTLYNNKDAQIGRLYFITSTHNLTPHNPKTLSHLPLFPNCNLRQLIQFDTR